MFRQTQNTELKFSLVDNAGVVHFGVSLRKVMAEVAQANREIK